MLLCEDSDSEPVPLSAGVFPQNEYPEEVSTDEDDDMFGSRTRMKRGSGHTVEDEEEEGAPAQKKSKGNATAVKVELYPLVQPHQ